MVLSDIYMYIYIYIIYIYAGYPDAPTKYKVEEREKIQMLCVGQLPSPGAAWSVAISSTKVREKIGSNSSWRGELPRAAPVSAPVLELLIARFQKLGNSSLQSRNLVQSII